MSRSVGNRFEIVGLDVGHRVTHVGDDEGAQRPIGPDPRWCAVGRPGAGAPGDVERGVDDEPVDLVAVDGHVATVQVAEVPPDHAGQPVAEGLDEGQHRGPVVVGETRHQLLEPLTLVGVHVVSPPRRSRADAAGSHHQGGRRV
ncbi:MAG: hypothetical protein U5R31_00845 [Acidimicrobiia bacterium]|nr:hypothetical protein [Acidimicrobiia bacterium]